MNPALEKLRDELAEKYALEQWANSFFPGNTPEEDQELKNSWAREFMHGFTAAITALEQAAGEFDEKWAEALIDNQNMSAGTMREDALELMHDVFDQDKARIGLAELLAKNGEQAHLAWMETKARLAEANSVNESCHHEIDKLEARLAESRTYCIDQERKLQDKLTACEKKLAESEHQRQVHENRANKFLDKLARAEERVRELEADLYEARNE